VTRLLAFLTLIALLASPVSSQTRRTAPRTPAKPAAAPAAQPKTEPAMIMCPQPLGTGVQTKRSFCDVQIGRDPLSGIIVTLPPHSGPVTLTFDLHARHTYSEDQVRLGRGYRKYTASIGVLAMDNTLLARAFVQSEFRTSADLADRISGSGPGGLKAVAPTGTEAISIAIEEQADKVSILGEKLTEMWADGREEWQATGRPIAIISNVMVTYRPPAPPRRPAATRRK
jgi:hypothetical protein